MQITMEELERELKKFEIAKTAFRELVEKGATYDEVRISMIQGMGIGWGKASDNIEMLEKATGLTLPGYRPMPVPKRTPTL